MKKSYYLCPICGKHRFTMSGDFDICPHCGWENDSVMNDDPNYSGGANELSQNDFRLRYEYYLSINPDYHWAHDYFPEIPQIEPMNCPVCEKYRFQELTIEDIYCGKKPQDIYCRICGWRYDIEQTEHPALKGRNNELSLNEYREWYNSKIEENSEYCYFDEVTEQYVPVPHKCPVCGRYEFEDENSFDICTYCGWEDDGVQTDDPNYVGGANDLCLNEYKKAYQLAISQDPNYIWDNDPQLLADIIKKHFTKK